MNFFKCLGLIAVLTPILTSGTQASVGREIRPEIRLETVEADNKTGQVMLRMTVEVWDHVTEIGVKAFGDSSFIPGGLLYVYQAVSDQDTLELTLSFEIPEHDTVGVMFLVVMQSDRKEPWSRTFVVSNGEGNEDTVFQPRPIGDEVFRRGDRYFIRTSDTLMVLDSHPSSNRPLNRHLETPNAKHTPWPPAPDPNVPINVIHSNGAKVSDVDPATLDPIYFYPWIQWINRLAFDDNLDAKGADAIKSKIRGALSNVIPELVDDAPLPVLIDMRDPESEAIIRDLVPDLRASDLAGFEEATITKGTCGALLDAGVIYVPHISAMREGKPAVRESGQGDESNSDGSEPELAPLDVTARTTIWKEDFEGSWEADWMIADHNPGDGWDTWGTSYYRYTGSQSAWCSGVGSAIDGYGHAPNSWTDMELRYPIDVSGYTGIQLSFAFWPDGQLLLHPV